MSNYTTESKSQLAKLMATENIHVEHKKIHTAYFDIKNRVLALPIWKDMSGFTYDLLTGHEVGHALYTPLEGWHTAVIENKSKSYKHFLNVVEDARVEKKIQRRYPGLRQSFIKAYSDFMYVRDFFGIKNRNIHKLSFIDRLNILCKMQYSIDIDFNEKEQDIIERIKLIETWDDVVRLTDELYEYSKDEQYEHQLNDFNNFGKLTEGGTYEDDEDEDEDFFDGDDENGDDDLESGKGVETDGEDGKKTDDEEEDEGVICREKTEAPCDPKENFEPKCETEEKFRESQDLLLDDMCKEYIYADIPTPIIENIITPAKRVQELLSNHYDRYESEMVKGIVDDFKFKNEKYVSLLVKEFEMKKAAKSFSKSKVCDTGDIDINKLSSYKFDDNIFRKITIVPKGKSHGIILLLDGSGSMHSNMSGSLEQIIIFSMFCRKVRIPFVMYSFNDNLGVFNLDMNAYSYKDIPKFSTKQGELCCSFVRLREYISSKMNNVEYNKALSNLIMLKASYDPYLINRYYLNPPKSEELSNTPLNSAIIAMSKIMKQFKSNNNLDLTSLVIIHDGDSDSLKGVYRDSLDYPEKFDTRKQNVIIQDKKNNYQHQIYYDRNESEDQTASLINWFKNVTGSKVVGVFIVSATGYSTKNSLYRRFYYKDGSSLGDLNKNYVYLIQHQDALIAQLKKDKHLISNNKGYDNFFFIVGGKEMAVDDGELEISGKFTPGKLKNAFLKMNKKRQVSRLLVSKFIETVSIS